METESKLLPPNDLGFKSREPHCRRWTPLPISSCLRSTYHISTTICLLSPSWINSHSHPFISNHCSKTGILKQVKKKLGNVSPLEQFLILPAKNILCPQQDVQLANPWIRILIIHLSGRKVLASLLPYTLLVGVTAWHWLDLGPCKEMWDGEMQKCSWKFFIFVHGRFCI